MYIADSSNNRIRKVTISTGIITTFAGTGSTTYSGDNGPATSAALYYPQDAALDSTGRRISIKLFIKYVVYFFCDFDVYTFL